MSTDSSAEPLIDKLAGWPVAAYVTLLIYVTTLSFEYGFASYWYLPFELVEFSVENAFVAFFSLFILTAFGVLVFTVSREWKWYGGLISVLLILSMIASLISVSIRHGYIGSFLVLMVLAYCSWVFFKVFVKSPTSGQSKAWIQIGLLLSALFLAIPSAAAFLGYVTAYQKKEFLVLDTDPELVILRKYGTHAVASTTITVPLKTRNTTVERLAGSFRIVSLGGTKSPVIKIKKLGQIMPMPPGFTPNKANSADARSSRD